MYLCCVYLSLDNVENRHVDSLLGGAGDHDVFGLEESSHDIEDSCFSDGSFLDVW